LELLARTGGAAAAPSLLHLVVNLAKPQFAVRHPGRFFFLLGTISVCLADKQGCGFASLIWAGLQVPLFFFFREVHLSSAQKWVAKMATGIMAYF
jgi:hypothetical protein